MVDTTFGPTILHKPWTKKPPVGTQINRQHPLSRNLSAAFLFLGDLKNTAVSSLNFDLVVGEVAFGKGAMLVDDASTVRLDISPKILGAGTVLDSSYTIFMIADAHKAPVPTDDQVLVTTDTTTALTDTPLYFDNLGSNGRLTTFVENGGLKTAPTTEPNFSPGVIETFGATYDEPSTVVTVYLNGGNLAGGDEDSDARSTYGESTIQGSTLRCFTQRTGAVQFDGDVYLFLAWENRALSAAEYASIHSNPWQIFQPRTIFIPEPDELNLVVF